MKTKRFALQYGAYSKSIKVLRPFFWCFSWKLKIRPSKIRINRQTDTSPNLSGKMYCGATIRCSL